MCCCFRTCCNRNLWIRKGTAKYLKFQLALERLSKEGDIQYIIEMNRISSLLHRINFLGRQRLAVRYSHRYVISDKDIKKAEKEKPQAFVDDDPNTIDKKVLEGFDPINNQLDRRMLFEVTGMRLHSDEFNDNSSSDS